MHYAFAMFSAHALREKRNNRGVHYLETSSKLEYRFACFALLCLLGVLYGFLDKFFLLSVHASLLNTKKKK